ncbi:hypothetical protein R3P38DRAFT_3206256 [Favolaschia claudopus]|uniref:Uncharacterized protein n=1 Tax=Favolaschia claudopus TaxID=2862362 RepID=A0AAW0ALJ7_9AGAR
METHHRKVNEAGGGEHLERRIWCKWRGNAARQIHSTWLEVGLEYEVEASPTRGALDVVPVSPVHHPSFDPQLRCSSRSESLPRAPYTSAAAASACPPNAGLASFPGRGHSLPGKGIWAAHMCHTFEGLGGDADGDDEYPEEEWEVAGSGLGVRERRASLEAVEGNRTIMRWLRYHQQQDTTAHDVATLLCSTIDGLQYGTPMSMRLAAYTSHMEEPADTRPSERIHRTRCYCRVLLLAAARPKSLAISDAQLDLQSRPTLTTHAHAALDTFLANTKIWM